LEFSNRDFREINTFSSGNGAKPKKRLLCAENVCFELNLDFDPSPAWWLSDSLDCHPKGFLPENDILVCLLIYHGLRIHMFMINLDRCTCYELFFMAPSSLHTLLALAKQSVATPPQSPDGSRLHLAHHGATAPFAEELSCSSAAFTIVLIAQRVSKFGNVGVLILEKL
jgi:hypothetical protein